LELYSDITENNACVGAEGVIIIPDWKAVELE